MLSSLVLNYVYLDFVILHHRLHLLCFYTKVHQLPRDGNATRNGRAEGRLWF